MRVRLSENAASDLHRIIDYLEERNPVAAAETVEAILEGIELLKTYPDLGRRNEEAGVRELIIDATFVVPYIVHDEVIEIVRIWHGAQDRTAGQ